MRQVIKLLSLGLILVFSGVAQAVVVTFDDLPRAVFGYGSVYDGYNGLNWDNFGYVDSADSMWVGDSGFKTGRVSGDNVAFNEWASASSANGSLFDFNGAYLTGAFRDGLVIQVEGFVNNILTYVETVIVDSDTATWFDFDFFGIDSLTFSSSGGVEVPGLAGSGTTFVMDNFTFNEVAAVPLPAAIWLFGAGFCMIAGLRRRKQNT